MGVRLKQRYIQLLKQGLTPDKLALCVALGIVIGVFPMLGSTTLLCAVAAFACGLNQSAIQTVNYLVYPLQLALLIPFYRLGEKLFLTQPLGLSLSTVEVLFAVGLRHAMSILWNVTIHAIAAWCLVAPVMIALLYRGLRPIFRKLAKSGLTS